MIKITITAKIKIIVASEQEPQIIETLKQVRIALNIVSEYVFETKELKQAQLQKALYERIRTEVGLKSQMTQSVFKTVIAKYKTLKSNNHDWTLVKFKRAEYDMVLDRDYSIVRGKFSLNTLQGRIVVEHEPTGTEEYFDGSWSFGTAKLVFKHDKYFLHIPMTKEFEQTTLNDINKVVGIDLGINFLATTYDSYGDTTFYDGKHIKHKRAELKAKRKELQEVNTDSSKRKIRKMSNYENRYVTDINHTITKELINKYGENTLFVLEDLTGIRKSLERVRTKDRYVSVSWAYNQFVQFLKYKAQLNKCIVVEVDARYTSQTCPKCGHTEKLNRNKKLHKFQCKNCNYQSNDDRIGAMNIFRKGIEYISKECVDE